MYKQAQEALQNHLEKVSVSLGWALNPVIRAAEGVKTFAGRKAKSTGIVDSIKNMKDSIKPTTLNLSKPTGKGTVKTEVKGPTLISQEERIKRNNMIRDRIAEVRRLRAEQGAAALEGVEGKRATDAVIKRMRDAGFVDKAVKNNDVMETLNRRAALSQKNLSSGRVKETMANPWVNRGLMIGGGALGGGLIGSALASPSRSDNGQYA